MFRKITDFFIRYIQKFMPDPFLFVLILTLLVVLMMFVFVPNVTVPGVIDAWYQGVWGKQNIFTFALQMTLILVTGTTLAQSPLVKKGLQRLALLPQNQVQAAILCFLAGAVGSIINWGFGLIVGTIIAKEIAKRLEKLDFGYVVAAAYMGYLIWASGFSSSIVLASADPTSALNIIYKYTKQTVGIENTIFTAYNIVPVVLMIIIIPFLLKFMEPKTIHAVNPEFLINSETQTAATVEQPTTKTFASVLENAWILNLIVVIVGFYEFFGPLKGNVTINSMILLFTILGMLLHWTPISYVRSFVDSAKNCGSLLLQYPLYGGIMALLAYTPLPGILPLQTVLAKSFVQTATVHTLPFMNYLASCVITLFVPSGGGHWGVQGPVAVQAALAMGQSSPEYLGKTAMSVAFGEQVFNMIQPFWALPVLAMAKLTIRDIMGYCVMTMIVSFVVFGLSLLLL